MVPKRRNQVSFLLLFAFVLSGFISIAQAPTEMFARVFMLKVPAGKQAEFETFMKDKMKPVQELRREKGKIILWILFKVHLAGETDEYNYADVSYYPSWANTEANLSLPALVREAHEGADAAQFIAKLHEVCSITKKHMLYRTEAVEPNPPVPSKYVRLDYMKIKPGKTAEYLRVERDDWMPFHQSLVNEGKSSGWGLWQLVFPGGTDASYDYVTSNRYSTYDQILGTDYAGTFKKVSPGKNVNDIFMRATNSRDLVRSEVWEVVDMLQ